MEMLHVLGIQVCGMIVGDATPHERRRLATWLIRGRRVQDPGGGAREQIRYVYYRAIL
jgi:hypothetical protein